MIKNKFHGTKARFGILLNLLGKKKKKVITVAFRD